MSAMPIFWNPNSRPQFLMSDASAARSALGREFGLESGVVMPVSIMSRMTELLMPLHSAEQVRAMDRDAIERLGIPGYTLMTRAGAAALRILKERWPKAKRVTIVCGSGNNAGDGYVVARLARREGLQITVVALFAPESLKGDAHVAWKDFASEGGQVVSWSNKILTADVIVDAIFGTGLSRPLDA